MGFSIYQLPWPMSFCKAIVSFIVPTKTLIGIFSEPDITDSVPLAKKNIDFKGRHTLRNASRAYAEKDGESI